MGATLGIIHRRGKELGTAARRFIELLLAGGDGNVATRCRRRNRRRKPGRMATRLQLLLPGKSAEFNHAIGYSPGRRCDPRIVHSERSEARAERVFGRRKQGLYDPAFEHESCGVGFVAHIKGLRSHQIVLDAEEVLRNMDHRGACGCEANTGDGAGILTALPHEFLAQGRARPTSKSSCREPGQFAAGIVFLPQIDAERRALQGDRRARSSPSKASGSSAGEKCPTDAEGADIGPTALAGEPCDRAALHRRRRRPLGRRVRAAAVPDPQAGQPPAPQRRIARAGQDVLHLSPVDQGDHLQGHAHHRPALPVFPRPRRPGLHQPPGDGPLAVLDEHVSLVGPRPADAAS